MSQEECPPNSEGVEREGAYPPVLPLAGSLLETRTNRLQEHFFSKFKQMPLFYVRVPGRVNLIGEHIDYCGYSVCPMAIQQDIIVAVGLNDTGALELTNLDSKYADFSATNIKSVSIPSDGRPEWHHYFLCGVIGVTEVLNRGDGPVGMCAAVTGDIPPNSGLSSSSALVSAAALATLHANQVLLSKLAIALLAAKSERYIGTEGGGMDQAIAFLGTKGCAKHIEFNPLRSEDVTLPDGAVFVIAHSLAEHNKAATSDFNCRVVECRLASQMIAKKMGLAWEKMVRLADLQRSLGLSLDEMIAQVMKLLHEEPYTKEEICAALEVTSDKLTEVSLSNSTVNCSQFKLRQRALHVFQEASRVEMFRATCSADLQPDTLRKLGDLMRKSHTSLQQLYECSHPALDRVVELGGDEVLGARLTGAGWGGCVVALTTRETSDRYISVLKEKFYRDNPSCDGRDVGKLVFATEPYDGAAIYTA